MVKTPVEVRYMRTEQWFPGYSDIDDEPTPRSPLGVVRYLLEEIATAARK